LAHEIGNPIAALMGMLDLLLDGDQPEDVERDFLRRMRGETERIHKVVRDLLDFARPSSASTRAESGPVAPAHVASVAGDVLALVRPQRASHAIEFDLQIDGELRVVMSAAELTQVLLNLVLNATAAVTSNGASGSGGGRVAVRAGAVEGGVRIVVEDDGPGVDPGVRDRLFEPFITTKGVGEGTGLGLAVCRGLVESAGGEIGVDPSFSGGARFFVVLPAAGHG
jgi:two-component system NtrC family sensor kinase